MRIVFLFKAELPENTIIAKFNKLSPGDRDGSIFIMNGKNIGEETQTKESNVWSI